MAMIRYDIYEQQLNPGDYICCVLKGELVAATIHSITLKGTLRICIWNEEREVYSAIPRLMYGCKIIKIMLRKPTEVTQLSSGSTKFLG